MHFLSSKFFCYHPLSAQTTKNVIHQAMSEIEEKTKVHGKTCIHFKPRSGEAEFIKFQNVTAYAFFKSTSIIFDTLISFQLGFILFVVFVLWVNVFQQ